jgi:predicted transcriptional regulator
MSPRAAWRLKTLGFDKVYDYVAGKEDWFAAGLPRQGRLAGARRDDITCALTDRIGDVVARVRAAGKDACVVVTDGGVVLGRVRGEALEATPDSRVEQVMESGPTTTRMDSTLASLVDRLKARRVRSIMVTTSDGRFVGTLHRQDAERRLENEAGADEGEGSCDCGE